jgi:hypothetical protein
MARRFTLGLLIVLTVLATLKVAQTQEAAPKPQPAPATRPAEAKQGEIQWYSTVSGEDWPATAPAETLDNAAVEKKLREGVVKRLTFDEQEFEEVLQYLREASGLNINVKWTALEAMGVDKQTPVTVNLHKVSYRKALDIILENVGGMMGQLNYIIEDGVITISTSDDLAQKIVVRLYRVDDLTAVPVAVTPEHAGPPWQRSILLPSAHPKEEDEGHCWCQCRGEFTSRDLLLKTIMRTVEPSSWSPHGGRMEINVWSDSLIIVQSRPAHDQIEQFLDQLRQEARQRRLRVGLAVVRGADVPAVRAALGRKQDIAAALEANEGEADWQLDRCGTEDGYLRSPLSAISLYTRQVAAEPVAGLGAREAPKAAAEGQAAKDEAPAHGVELLTGEGVAAAKNTHVHGYQLGVLPVARGEDGAVEFSVACAAAWVSQDAEPEDDTPYDTTGVHRRHNVSQFTIRPGEFRLVRVIPAGAKDGPVTAVVWLPKE